MAYGQLAGLTVPPHYFGAQLPRLLLDGGLRCFNRSQVRAPQSVGPATLALIVRRLPGRLAGATFTVDKRAAAVVAPHLSRAWWVGGYKAVTKQVSLGPVHA